MASPEGGAILRRPIASWEPRIQSEPGKLKRRRTVQALLDQVEARYGIEAAAEAEREVATASLEEIRLWARRAHYQPSWQAVLEGRPLVGVRLVSIGDVFVSAIGNPLETWCLRAYYTSKGDDLRDTETLLWEAPWLRENFSIVGGLVADLQFHRTALLSCESEDLARGLKASVNSRRLWFHLYKPDGSVTG